MSTTIDGQEFVSLHDFCNLAGIVPQTAIRWNKQGKGPVRIRVGNNTYYRATEVREWLNSNGETRKPVWTRVREVPPMRDGVTADYVTRRELCAILGLSYSTVSKWATYGNGPPYFNIGKKVFYRRADVEAWLADQRRAA